MEGGVLEGWGKGGGLYGWSRGGGGGLDDWHGKAHTPNRIQALICMHMYTCSYCIAGTDGMKGAFLI